MLKVATPFPYASLETEMMRTERSAGVLTGGAGVGCGVGGVGVGTGVGVGVGAGEGVGGVGVGAGVGVPTGLIFTVAEPCASVPVAVGMKRTVSGTSRDAVPEWNGTTVISLVVLVRAKAAPQGMPLRPPATA